MTAHKYTVAPFAVFAALLLAGQAQATTFDDTLAATYQNNPRIKAARQKLEATDEGVPQALSGLRPSVGVNYERGRERTAFGGAKWSYSDAETKALRVSQPISGFGTWSSFESASQRVKAGQYDLSATEQSVLLEATRAFMDVAAAYDILKLSQTNASVLEKQLDSARTRFQVGEVTRTDVAQSESRLSGARSQVVSAEGDLLAAVATYERVVGFKPEGDITLPDKLPELPLSLDEALKLSHSANPQLLAAIHSAKASKYDVHTNEADLLPRVALVGTMSRQEGAGSTGTSDFDQDKIAVEVSMPLYQAGSEYSRVREASAVARQRDHESTDTRLSIDESVVKAWNDLETAKGNILMRDDQIKAAQIALDGVKQEQQYGTRTVLDVLDAENELFNARINQVRARRDRVVAAYTLATSLGQLTPANLALKVESYDPKEHAEQVKWQPIGF